MLVAQKPILDEIDQIIIATLKNSDGLSTKKIAESISKSQRTTRMRLISLIEKELVVEISKNINDPGRKYFYKK